MAKKARQRAKGLRVVRVSGNPKRHVVRYCFSDGRRLHIYFVSNLHPPWREDKYFRLVHSVWLIEARGTKLLGGVIHNPIAREPSQECYFYTGEGLTRETLLGYCKLANRRVRRSWGRKPEFLWIAPGVVTEGWDYLLERLKNSGPPNLPDALVNHVPGID